MKKFEALICAIGVEFYGVSTVLWWKNGEMPFVVMSLFFMLFFTMLFFKAK